MVKVNGKNALVTGSSRGIGQQIAIGLAQLGCNVIVHGRTDNSCKRTIEMLKEYDVQVYSVYGELLHESEVKSIYKQVNNLGVHVDILYNNAAVCTNSRDDYWNHSYEDWMTTFKVNVFAIYGLCALFVPNMVNRGYGRVVNITSGTKGKPELAPYSASKAAVNKLTEDLAVKFENTGVRINAINPGWLRTDMGGENADHAVEEIVPGILKPVLIEDDGPNGKIYTAF